MAQLDALRSTGRARGVQEASDLAGAILLNGLRLRIRIEWTNTDSTERSHSVYFGADAAGVIGCFLRKRRVNSARLAPLWVPIRSISLAERRGLTAMPQASSLL